MEAVWIKRQDTQWGSKDELNEAVRRRQGQGGQDKDKDRARDGVRTPKSARQMKRDVQKGKVVIVQGWQGAPTLHSRLGVL